MYNPVKPYKKEIKNLIRRTWDVPYLEIIDGIYPQFRKIHNAFEIDHTDGIGTKGFYHWKQQSFRNAVLDAMAMNENDLAVAGAKGYKVQVHLVLPEDLSDIILEIMEDLSIICQKKQIAITGGETAIIEGAIFDITLTMSGIIKEKRTDQCFPGDIVVGIPSDGPHSNGFTLIRSLYENEFLPWMITPTRSYIHEMLDKDLEFNAAAHITGGAFSKIKDILPQNCDMFLDWEVPTFWKDFVLKGVPSKTMYETFNCGLGMILSIPKSQALNVKRIIADAWPIGYVAKGNHQIIIKNAFGDGTLTL